METIKDTIKVKLSQPNNSLGQTLYTRNTSSNGHGEDVILEPIQTQPTKGKTHACQASQRFLQQASDRLSRANRDLGETAAFLAASLTTLTAIEAVINTATEKIGIPIEILRVISKDLAILFLGILVWGILRALNAIQRRARAEQNIDQAKQGIFEFCSTDQWPKLDG
jgi:hypothetical protein